MHIELTVAAHPGRHHLTIMGRYGTGAMLGRQLHPAQVTVEVAERTDRVEFNDAAFDLLDKLFED